MERFFIKFETSNIFSVDANARYDYAEETTTTASTTTSSQTGEVMETIDMQTDGVNTTVSTVV